MYYNEMRNDFSYRGHGRKKANGVNLLTIHGAKGLEFNTVFLLKF